MKGARACCTALAWLALLQPGAAHAQAGWVHLTWQPPLASTCPPRAVIEREVEHALGRPVFTSAHDARLSVLATIEDRASGVRVQLRARNAVGAWFGTRELRAQPGRCASLRDDISLVLTLLAERSMPETPGPQLQAGLWAGATVNSLPRASFVLGPSLVLDLGAYLQLRADGMYWVPVAVETAGGIHADLQAASLGLRVCLRLFGSARSLVSLQLCAGTQLGALFTSQTAPNAHATEVRLWAQGVAELRAGLRLWSSTSRVELAAGPLLSLDRTRVLGLGSDGSRALLYRPPLLGMILSLGVII